MKHSRFFRVLSMALVVLMALSVLAPASVRAAAPEENSGKASAVEICVNEQKTLRVSHRFGETTWTTSDPAVVTVDPDGTITARAEGTATVTATFTPWFSFIGKPSTDTFLVTVTGAADAGLSVQVQQTLPLSVHADGGTVTWSSSDEQIAVVSAEGVVTGVNPGEVRITAEIVRVESCFFGWIKREIRTTEVFDVTVLPAETSTYTVTFEPNGGSAVEAQLVEAGKQAAEPQAPTRENYELVGWYTDPALETAYDFSTPVTSDLTLYAKWEAIPAEYSVIFESNGGTVVFTQFVEEGMTVQKPDDPVKRGYTFAGWFADPELTEAYDFAAPVTENLTLYAKWEEIQPTAYTVTFESNGGSAVEAQTVEAGMTAAEPVAPEKPDFVFMGWFLDPELTEAYDFAAPVTQDLTLYAGWAVEHWVSFESNGGTVVLTQFVAEGQPIAKPDDPVKSGCTFTGWFTDPELTQAYDFAAPVMQNMVLYAKWDSAQKDSYTVTFDSTGGSAVAPETVPAGGYAELKEVPVREGYMFGGWSEKPDGDLRKDVFHSRKVAIERDMMLYAMWISMADTDGEQLVDGLELYYGTDLENPDTDGDSLTDYVEIVLLGTDPLSAEDADRDTDGDTLTNAEEIKLGTDPSQSDTDMDGLRDDEELKLGTDPLNDDTDSDGASDGTEIRLGTDPLTADAAFHVTEQSQMEDTVSVSVELDLQGNQVDSLTVDAVNDGLMFPEDMPGYLGMAYQFHVDGSFQSATIRFAFDPASLPENADPVIYYFNEETQELEPLETVVENGTASAVVTHFSTYVLIDRRVYEDTFIWIDTWDSEQQYTGVEIVLAIDDSGSMRDNDPQYQRLSVASELIDQLPENSKIGIVQYESDVTVLTEALTADRNAAKAYLTRNYFQSSGGTYMYTGIDRALTLYQSTDPQIMKVMIVLSDGQAHDSEKHSSIIASAQQAGVKIYTVGLGPSESSFNQYLKPIASETGGAFYLASNADALAEIYKNISQKIDLQTDDDGDGIPNYYEDHMVAFNGRTIHLDKNNPDTDGDGLQDGREVKVHLVYNEDNTKVSVRGKLLSYPDRKDSDHDGIKDRLDPKPMSFTITDHTLSWIEGLSYTNLHKYEGKTLGQAIKQGLQVEGVSDPYCEYLKDAVIVRGNDSGAGWWNWNESLNDGGLGCIALKIVRHEGKPAIVVAMRGTEPNDDMINDGLTDIWLGMSWSSQQSGEAMKEYRNIARSIGYDYYITGHSLGGRLALDAVYKIYKANEGGLFKAKAHIPVPVHVATYNGLGYDRATYATLKNKILEKYEKTVSNFYFWQDWVGQKLGNAELYTRPGRNIELYCENADGSYDRAPDGKIHVADFHKHGIENFHNYYDLVYTGPGYPYWVRP